MATKKAAPAAGKAPGGGLSARIVGGAVAVAIISAISSFVAIRFALPKQIIVEQRTIIETPKPLQQVEREGDLWTLGDNLIVNLADPGRHFLRVTVTLKVAKAQNAATEKKSEGGGEGGGDSSKAIAARLKPWEPVLRDGIIRTLRMQTVASLFDQDRVKSEIKVTLNRIHQQDDRAPEVLEVYFGDFVVQ